jgi:ketosteroid isomerase-like protein
MPASPPPSSPEQQLRWLVDRAQISDLLVEFARALDERDWAAYAATYTHDGVLERPGMFRFEGRTALRAGVEDGLGRFAGTWHLSANHAIELDGDEARTRSYLHGICLVAPASPERHVDAGGWYDCALRRTAEGWRLATVQLNENWAGPAEPAPAWT